METIIILDLHVDHVGGEAQMNILSILLWAPAVVGEQHCLHDSREIGCKSSRIKDDFYHCPHIVLAIVIFWLRLKWRE